MLYPNSSDIEAPRSGTHALANLNAVCHGVLRSSFRWWHAIEKKFPVEQVNRVFPSWLWVPRQRCCMHFVATNVSIALVFGRTALITCSRTQAFVFVFPLPGGRYFWCLFCFLFSESAHRKRKIMFKATSSSRVVCSGLDICNVCPVFFVNACCVHKERLRTPAIPFRGEEREGKSERATGATLCPPFQTCEHSRERQEAPRTERTDFFSVHPF